MFWLREGKRQKDSIGHHGRRKPEVEVEGVEVKH